MTDADRGRSGYYGKPIVRAHVWTDEVAWYFFTGGLAGASSVIAAAAELTGRPQLAKQARRAAMIGLAPSPVLLVADLARPARFYNMLRVFKPTSPMSVGSWLLSVYAPAAGASWLLREVGRLPRLARLLGVAAGVVGPTIATYTAVLVADTATPVWHEG
ncbi:MAG: NrfD/PsrC family molybdoenzyme membrane anchor subunit, partial [Ilumatobacteraceae bacterium]